MNVYTLSKLMMYMEERNMQKSFACQSFSLCVAVWPELCFLCLIAVCVLPKSLSSSRRFLCPVVVRVRLKLLSSSGLSSAELAL